MSGSISERRRHERFLAGDNLISISLQPLGYDREVWGIVTDTSDSGFQISIPLQIPPETKVKVVITRQLDGDRTEIEHLVGLVRWCHDDAIIEDTYTVGIEICVPG
jgi:hypothetical protein